MPLGLMANASYVTHSVQTVPGAMLVLYTDGALEHSHDVIAGERILLDAVAQASRAGAADAAGVIRDAIFAGRSAGDDVAILTIAFAAAPAPSRSRTVGAGRAGEDPGR
jgi:serine phosphatase RsbU (regulator of sigma subunit)